MKKDIKKFPLKDTGQHKRPTFFRLKSISYSEYLGDPKQWVLEEFELGDITLLVGKNASGKSRLLRLIVSLARLLNGEFSKVFESGNFKICLNSEEISYIYELHIHESAVIKEVLSRNSNVLLDRGKDGIGTIWAEKLGSKMDFGTPPDQIAARSRRDSIQHPFFEDLHNWATLLKYFEFGTTLGRDQALLMNELSNKSSEIQTAISENSEKVTRIYVSAFRKYREEFDKAVLRDLAALGYSCTAVDATSENFPGISSPVILLQVKEKDVGARISQLSMSQGMFRALALVIQLNYIIFEKTSRTILIDDIGEGLDYARSQSFISLLIERSRSNKMQLLMTTNDRFVMNGVPLEHWGVISRKGSRIKVINRLNSEHVFSEYEELGLNNFDFFSGNFFEEGAL